MIHINWWQRIALGFVAAFLVMLAVGLATGHNAAVEMAFLIGLLGGAVGLAEPWKNKRIG